MSASPGASLLTLVGLRDLRGLSGRMRVLAVALVLVVATGGLIAFVNVARAAVNSDAEYAGGMLVLGLGLLAAVVYGISRSTSIGVLVWLAAMIIAPVAPGGMPLDQLAFAAVLATWFVEVVSNRRPFPHLGAIEFLMVTFLVLTVASMLVPHELAAVDDLGAKPLLPLIITGTIYPFTAFVLARQVFLDERDVRRLLRCLVALGLYLGLTNIVWILGMHNLVIPADILNDAVGSNADRGRGIFLNPAATGFVLVVCFAATMYLAVQRATRLRVPLVISAVVMLVGVGLTQTRSAWLSAGLVIVFGALAFSPARRWYLLFLVAIGLIIVANWSTFTSDDRSQGGVTSVNEADDRLNAAATALWGVEQKPVFGWGLGRFQELNTIHHRAWGDTPWKRGYGVIAHDTQLGIAAELGLVGLGVWLGILAAMVIASRRAWRVLPRSGLVSRWLALLFWSACLAWVATSSLIDIRLFAFPNALLFVLGGMVIGLADRAERDRAAGVPAPLGSAAGQPPKGPGIP